MVALTAVAVLALGTILRKSAGAVTAGIVVFVLPYIIGSALSGSADRWLFRLTPAAGFAVLGSCPTSAGSATPTPSPTATTRSPRGPASPSSAPTPRSALGCGHLPAAPERRMTEALRAEWTKLRTAGQHRLAARRHRRPHRGGQRRRRRRHPHQRPAAARTPPSSALTGIHLGQAVIAVLAVLAISEEYGTGMIRVTLTAMPRRLVLLAAKAANLAGLTLVAGLIAVAGCLLAGRLILPGAGLDPAHGYAARLDQPRSRRCAPRPAASSTSSSSHCSASASPPPSATPPYPIGAVLGLLYLPPILAQAVSDPLRRHLEQIAPMTAGLAIQATTNLRSLPIAPWAGLGVLAALGSRVAPHRRTAVAAA